MNKKVSQFLVALGGIDRKMVGLLNRKEEVEQVRTSLQSELKALRDKLMLCETSWREKTVLQDAESLRLRDEEQKLVNRRKQLTQVGGVKVARFVEREIDLASRALKTLEEQALRVMEEIDQLGTECQELRQNIEQMELRIESDTPEQEALLLNLNEELLIAEEEREKVVVELDERAHRLYERVKARYPAEPVALVENGSCRCCFRALPPQLYHQLLAGATLLQCPGCSRILVVIESQKEE